MLIWVHGFTGVCTLDLIVKEPLHKERQEKGSAADLSDNIVEKEVVKSLKLTTALNFRHLKITKSAVT